MATWLVANIGTILASLVIAGFVALIIISMIKDKKKGRNSCGCGCANCALNGTCHARQAKKAVKQKTVK